MDHRTTSTVQDAEKRVRSIIAPCAGLVVLVVSDPTLSMWQCSGGPSPFAAHYRWA